MFFASCLREGGAGHDDDLSIVEVTLRFLSGVTMSQMEADEHWSGRWCRALAWVEVLVIAASRLHLTVST